MLNEYVLLRHLQYQVFRETDKKMKFGRISQQEEETRDEKRQRRRRGGKGKSEQNESRARRRSSGMTVERVRDSSREKGDRRVSNVAKSLGLRTFSVSLIGSHSMRQQVMGQLQQLMAQTNLYGYQDIITSGGIRETHTVSAV